MFDSSNSDNPCYTPPAGQLSSNRCRLQLQVLIDLSMYSSVLVSYDITEVTKAATNRGDKRRNVPHLAAVRRHLHVACCRVDCSAISCYTVPILATLLFSKHYTHLAAMRCNLHVACCRVDGCAMEVCAPHVVRRDAARGALCKAYLQPAVQAAPQANSTCRYL